MKSKDQSPGGHWYLSDEILAFPKRFWSFFIIDMESEKQLASWKVAATASDESTVEVFLYGINLRN